MSCEHMDFSAVVEVNRLKDTEDGPVIAYSADIHVNCADCGEAFVWLGPPVGLLPTEPAVSVDGTELRAPLRPASAIDHKGMPAGFRVQAR